MDRWLAAAHQTTKIGVESKSDQHTFEGDACCLLTDTRILELIFDGASLVLFEQTLWYDLGGKNDDDFGSPTLRKPTSKLHPPIECLGMSGRFPTSSPTVEAQERQVLEGRAGRFFTGGRLSFRRDHGGTCLSSVVGSAAGNHLGLLLKPTYGCDVRGLDVNSKSGCP